MSEPRETTIHVLWARSDRYKTPQFVSAWGSGLYEAMREWYIELRAEKVRWWLEEMDDSDGPWTFWETVEAVRTPVEIDESELVEVPR